MIAFASEKGAQTLTIIFLAKLLGAMEYGRLTLAQGMVNTSQIFVLLGAGTILARYIPEMLEDSARRAIQIVNLCFLVVLATGVLLAILGVSGASVIAVSFLDLSPVSSIPYWVIAWVLFTAINGLLTTIMLSFEKGHITGAVSFASALCTIVIVPLTAAKWGFFGAVIALTITCALKTALFMLFYFQLLRARGVPLLTPPSRSDVPLLLSFGLPVFLSSALWAPTMWFAQIILKEVSPMGLISVGVFGFCNNILGLVVLMSSITNRAAFPILSSLTAQGDIGETKRFTVSVLVIQILAAITLGAPIMIFSSQIMMMMGTQFSGQELSLIIIVAAGVVISGQQPLINILLVNDLAFTNLLGMAIWSASLLALSLLFAHMGALGIAYAVLAAAITKGIFIAFPSAHCLKSKMKEFRHAV